jgi:hypothetical protein
VEAWRAILGWAERKARLLGLDAPIRSQPQIIATDKLDAEIEALVAELAATPAIAAEVLPPAAGAAALRPPGEHRGPSRMMGEPDPRALASAR